MVQGEAPSIPPLEANPKACVPTEIREVLATRQEHRTVPW